MPLVASSAARRLVQASLLGVLLSASVPALAGPIAFDAYLQFSFAEAGTVAAGCAPDDPLGAFCFPSSGTPTTFLDAAPWTFLADASGATLTVVDAFLSGDRFEIFDFGTSLGLTSVPGEGADCGDDPLTCLADANMSKLVIALGAGLHSVTIVATLVPDFGGTGYLQATGTTGTTPVPEPASWPLFALGLIGVGVIQTRRSPAVRSAA